MRDGTVGHGRSSSSALQRAAAGILASAFLGASGTPAAAETEMLQLAGLTALPDARLDNLRGGFFVGPFFINFGVKITTMVNDVRVLETSFNVVQPNQIGDVRATIVQDVPSVVQGTGGSPGGGASGIPGGSTSGSTGGNSAAGGGTPSPSAGPSPESAGGGTAVPSSGTGGALDLQDLSNGIRIDVGEGTRILQRLGNGVVTQILNSANGQTIRHATEMNLFITNFSAVVDMGRLNLGLNNLARESARIGLGFGQ